MNTGGRYCWRGRTTISRESDGQMIPVPEVPPRDIRSNTSGVLVGAYRPGPVHAHDDDRVLSTFDASSFACRSLKQSGITAGARPESCSASLLRSNRTAVRLSIPRDQRCVEAAKAAADHRDVRVRESGAEAASVVQSYFTIVQGFGPPRAPGSIAVETSATLCKQSGQHDTSSEDNLCSVMLF